MTEQERLSKRKQRQKRPAAENSTVQPAASSTRQEEAEKKLSEVDAAFDDYLMATSTPTAGSIAAGQQQPHQVVRPLSDEALVRGFRQTSGE